MLIVNMLVVNMQYVTVVSNIVQIVSEMECLRMYEILNIGTVMV